MRLESQAEILGALRDALLQADAAGVREMTWCDVDYLQWPISEAAVLDALTRWAQPHRRLTLYALHYEPLAARHPRWVAWRRRFAHVVACRALLEVDAAQVPSLLIAPGLGSLRCSVGGLRRGMWSTEAAETERSRLRLDALAQRSTDAFAATTLGL